MESRLQEPNPNNGGGASLPLLSPAPLPAAEAFLPRDDEEEEEEEEDDDDWRTRPLRNIDDVDADNDDKHWRPRQLEMRQQHVVSKKTPFDARPKRPKNKTMPGETPKSPKREKRKKNGDTKLRPFSSPSRRSKTIETDDESDEPPYSPARSYFGGEQPQFESERRATAAKASGNWETLARWTRVALALLTPCQVGLHAPPHPLDLDDEATAKLEAARGGETDDVLQLSIVETGRMSDEPDIIHPLVRLHIVDATTGHYLAKPHVIDDATTRRSGATRPYERSSVIFADSRVGIDAVDDAVDHVLPIATQPCHLSGRSIRPKWDETYVVDIPFDTILSPHALFLFEIVDFCHGLGRARGRDSSSGLYGLAWTFLRPVGPRGEINVATSKVSAEAAATTDRKAAYALADELATFERRLQLFHYEPLSRKARLQAQRFGLVPPPPPASARVPAVYLQWLRRRYRKYSSTLFVRANPVLRPEPARVPRRPRIPMEFEITTDAHFLSPFKGQLEQQSPEPRAMRAARRARRPNEQCVLPDRLLCRLVPGTKGALTIRFSPTGRMLAVACCEDHIFPIRLYDVTSHAPPETPSPDEPRTAAAAAAAVGLAANKSRDGAILVADLEGHHGMVYDMRWSQDERLLLSASGDCTAKLWFLGALGLPTPATSFEKHREEDNDDTPHLIAIFERGETSFVYCAAFITFTSVSPPPQNSDNDDDDISTTSKHQRAARSEASTRRPESDTQLPELRVVTGSFDGAVRYWHTTGHHAGRLGNKFYHDGHVNAIEVDARSGRLYSADSHGRIVVWKREGDGSRVEHYTMLRSLDHPDLRHKAIVSMMLHPRRRRGQLLVQAQNTYLKLVDLTTNNVVTNYKGNRCETVVVRAVFSPDGLMVMSGSEDGAVYVWDTATGRRLHLPFGDICFHQPVCDLSWHPTQHAIAFTAYGGAHPVLVYCARRPAQPEPIVPLASTASRVLDASTHRPAATTRAPERAGDGVEAAQHREAADRVEQRRRRIQELQARRRQLHKLQTQHEEGKALA
ncbi:hypothetical protein CTAYLR_000462 [Chrysophaeum taylorii]|uniref:Uncharacterized protein n=1 Tax=Chrysophaeum taylorii TaxID=2483200 RepID=A0AAD7XN64_9STRA|nr:hypothetical protein CTAYLR_000462 [Chrysophaeum taylorii]